jgi:hypothetical protein
MKRIRIAGLCLVAVFALSAVVASGASAAEMPVFKVCKKVAKGTGEFGSKTCTGAKGTGEYSLGEWNEGKEKEPKLKGKNGASTLTSYIKGFGIVGAVTCAKAKSEGHVTGSDTESVIVTFEKCESSKESCSSPGETKGKIKTFNLLGLLILISKEPPVVGVLIAGGGPGGKSAEFSCGAEKISTVGSVDGVLTGNVGKIGKETTSTFAVNAGGEIVGVGTFESGENTVSVTKGEEMEIVPE